MSFFLPSPASFIFVEHQGKYLTMMRGATARVRPNDWDLPGGKKDRGENPEITAMRELNEESGLELEVTSLTNLVDKPTHRHYFYFTATSPDGAVAISQEHTEYKWVELDELITLLTHEPHKQAATFLRSLKTTGRQ